MQHLSSSGHQDSGDHVKDRGVPLTIQGLRSNASETEFHAVFFDAEALVGNPLDFLIKLMRNACYSLLSMYL